MLKIRGSFPWLSLSRVFRGRTRWILRPKEEKTEGIENPSHGILYTMLLGHERDARASGGGAKIIRQCEELWRRSTLFKQLTDCRAAPA